MRYDQVVRSRNGTQRRIEQLPDIRVPDLWSLIMAVQDQAEGRESRPLTADDVEALTEAWSLCHDLLKHLRRVNVEERT